MEGMGSGRAMKGERRHRFQLSEMKISDMLGLIILRV